MRGVPVTRQRPRRRGPLELVVIPCTRCVARDDIHHHEIEQQRAGHWLCSRCDADYHPDLGQWELETVADAEAWDEASAELDRVDYLTRRAESGWAQ